jgi:hypothetical protein
VITAVQSILEEDSQFVIGARRTEQKGRCSCARDEAQRERLRELLR